MSRPGGDGVRRLRAAVLVLALGAVVGLVTRQGTAAPGTGAGGRGTARVPAAASVVVDRVVDGDTLVAGGEWVRLIGVDTPELHHPSQPVGCFARAVADYTTRKLAGRAVTLERDVCDRDAYRRALAYVWTGPAGDSEHANRAHLFNARLLSEGYAQVLTIPPDVRSADLFVRLEGEARAAGRGLGGACTL